MRLVWLRWTLLGLLILLLAFAPELTRFDPNWTNPDNQFAPPNLTHLLGTDQFGRDVLSRTLWGGRTSFVSSVWSASIALGIGTLIGALAGGYGGWTDNLLMRLMDALLSLPGVLFALVVVTLFGVGAWQAALGVGVSLMPGVSRVTRAVILAVRSERFIEASHALGASDWFIVRKHLIRHIVPQLLAFVPVIYGWSILNIAALEFLGLAGSPSTATLGRMLSEGRAYLRIAPWITLSPGLAIVIVMLLVTALSDWWHSSSVHGART